MTTGTDCACGGRKLSNGNCSILGLDGLPVQCVGIWASDKYHYLGQYIEATCAVRAEYLPPMGPGGAAFIDLFAGPGRVRVRETGEIKDGSPLIAAKHGKAPFSKLVFCEMRQDNVSALKSRTACHGQRVEVILGDCNSSIDTIAAAVPEHGLNIALIDPFGLQALKFATIERLGRFRRMDLVVHFPTGDIKRNLTKSENTRRWLSEALGTMEWESRCSSAKEVAVLVEVFKERLRRIGYGSEQVRSQPIKNSQNVTLYYLVYASKHPRGDAIWQSITRNTPSGQRGLGFD